MQIVYFDELLVQENQTAEGRDRTSFQYRVGWKKNISGRRVGRENEELVMEVHAMCFDEP
jgi:hypothetical protein